MPGGLYPPPSVIESWPKPNYVNPVTQGPALFYICIILSSLSLALVVARLYSRTFITKAPGADDLLVSIAAGFGIALSVLVIIQEKTWYTGHHIWDIPVTKFARQRKNIYICEWCYLTATCSVKISILLFYRRLAVTFSKTFLIATWIGILYNVLYFAAFSIALLTLFRPLDSYWLSFDLVWAATHEYSHGDEAWSLPVSGALSVFGDFYSTAIPLLLIRFLDLPSRQKAALYALFSLGFLVVGAGIVRTILLDRLISQTYDVSWVLWEEWVWTVIELNVAILAASAPALKPFFRRFLVDPILSSGKQASSYRSRRRSSSNAGRQPGSFRWSNQSTTARDSNVPVDMEKIGVAVTDPLSAAEMIEDQIDWGSTTRKYKLRTSRDGKLVPVQVNEQSTFDARSLHTARSTDHILPRPKGFAIDHQYQLADLNRGVPALPSPTSTVPKFSSQRDLRTPEPNRPRTASSATRGGSGVPGPLERHPSQSSSKSRSGSVRAARLRAQQSQLEANDLQERLQDQYHQHMHTRSISRGSERNFSLPISAPTPSSPYQHVITREGDSHHHFPQATRSRSSSEETLGLPRQGSRNEFRSSPDDVVGYAV